MSIRQFCDAAKAQLEKSDNFESMREFMLERVKEIIYNYGKITIVGSVPVKLSAYSDPDQTSEAAKIAFRIGD